MLTVTFVILTGLGSVLAGILGALTGLGGGVVIVPLLVLGFGVDIRYAMGASLISVIATSSGAAAAYVKEGFSNIRIGMFLEMATTAGALLGAYLAVRTSTNVIAIIFGAALVFSAFLAAKKIDGAITDDQPDRLAAWLRLNGRYPSPEGPRNYLVRHVVGGFGTMVGAGVLSGLLGIGSGAFKVVAMDQVMKIPFKVSTTTSNFMIGVTAAASAGVYLRRGFIDPVLAMPVMLGVLTGSLVGTRLLIKAKTKWLRIIFGLVIWVLGVEMIYGGFTGRL